MPIVRAVTLLLGLLAATLAHAAAQRTFVATTGADTNTAFNCSLVKPCRGFAAAIGVTNSNGEIIALDSGGYGPVTITKSVSLIAPPGVYAGISVFTGDGVTINAPGAIVVLRGLSINSQGGDRGISLLAAARVRVESCIVSGMHVAGISDTATDAELIVQDTIVRDNLGSGVYVFADIGRLVLDHVHSEHNGGNGLSLTPSVGSLGALATITDSIFTHNDGDGIGADSVSGATITLMVERSVLSNNGQNGFRADASGGSVVVTVSRSTINDNHGNGLFIGAGVEAYAIESVFHRNSGAGIVSEADSFVFLNANVFYRNVGNQLSCGFPISYRIIYYGNNSLVGFNGTGNCLYSLGSLR